MEITTFFGSQSLSKLYFLEIFEVFNISTEAVKIWLKIVRMKKYKFIYLYVVFNHNILIEK